MIDQFDRFWLDRNRYVSAGGESMQVTELEPQTTDKFETWQRRTVAELGPDGKVYLLGFNFGH